MAQRRTGELQPDLAKSPIHYFNKLLRASPQVVELHERQKSLGERYRSNREALADDPSVVPDSYGLESIGPDLRYYGVRLSKRGELFTTDFSAHPHLPRRREVPDALQLTVGDIDAAAQWVMLPKLDVSHQRAPQHEQAARLMINRITYETAQRHLHAEMYLYRQQIWEKMKSTGQSIEGLLVPEMAETIAVPVTSEMIHDHLNQDWVLAERVGATTLARVGSRTQPKLQVFQPSTVEDAMQKVDILARLVDANEQPWIAGLDMTNAHSHAVMRHKALSMRPNSVRSVSIRDPLTNRKVPLHREVAYWPDQAEILQMMKRWETERGSTMITPEYMMSSDARTRLVAMLLYKICTPTGDHVYNDEAIIKAYQTTYTDYDQRTME